MLLEVIAINLSDIAIANKCGVDRIELSPSMCEQGITPSYGLISEALKNTDIPINVIIRPHDQSFSYNEGDLRAMITDIEMVKQLGANGIVLGALTPDHQIDERALEKLLKAAEGLEVTFHRAFDFTEDLFQSLETLKKYKEINSILTSGGESTVIESVNVLKELSYSLADSHIELIVCRGLQPENLSGFLDQVNHVGAVHFGRGIRIQNSYDYDIDQNKIREIKQVLSKYKS